MPFKKIIKNKAYFKRYQTKYRRRREGKTDYYARRRLVTQDKRKYNSPKYRLVVRFTNKDVICQIVYSRIDGDYVMSAAYSHELPRYGITLGLTNYAAAYATGLLLARRVLTKLGLAAKYRVVPPIGEDYNVRRAHKAPRPFKALLDVGLARTSTGSRVFAAMKGACDGGINVPHSETRFIGWNDEESTLDSDVLRKHILGGHVADYMRALLEEDPEKFARQFSRYKKAGLGPDDLEALYLAAHRKIRKDPTYTKKEHKKPAEQKHFGQRRLTLAQRKERLAAKKIRLGYPKDAPTA